MFKEWGISFGIDKGLFLVIERCECGIDQTRQLDRREMMGNLSNVSFCEILRQFKKLIGDSTGQDAMQKADKFASENSDLVSIVRVDNNWHLLSYLVFMDCIYEEKYYGTVIVFISQCAGKKLLEFFLRPGMLFGFRNTLGKIESRNVRMALGNPPWNSLGKEDD